MFTAVTPTTRSSATHRRRVSATAAIAALTIVAALTGCSGGGSASADGSATSTGNTAASADQSATESAPGLNTAVAAGAFEFTVLSGKAAGTTVGTAPLTQTAQGSFYQVDLKVANTSDKPQTFIVNDVKLEDADGKTYDASASATLYASGDASTWVAAINPGNAIQGPVLFDLPAGVSPTQLLVSDNAFTKGTPIRLG